MIIFWLWQAVKCSNLFLLFPRYVFSAVDLCVYTSDKHFVRSQFILIAPLCQRLLTIFSQNLTTASLFYGAHTGTTDTDQTAFSSQRKLIITQSAFFSSLLKKKDLVFRKETEDLDMFCFR